MTPTRLETGHDPMQQAAGWCLKLSGSEATLEEQLEFEVWLEESPDNREAFRKAAALWSAVPETSDMPEVIGARADALEAMRAANQARWRPRLVRAWKPALALAASLCLVAWVSLLVLYDPATEYGTGIAERRVVQLEDGSRLSLDAATSVEVDYDDDSRSLRLVSGRAKFDVAKNAARPFTVRAADKLVVATGTSFSVELVRDQVHVILYEGSVEVIGASAADKLASRQALEAARRLEPGDELVSDSGRQSDSVTRADLPQSLDWQTGQLTFTGERLDVAVERVNRYSKQKIVVRDPRLASERISGAFNAGDPAAFIDGVVTLFPARAERKDGEIELVARN